MHITVFDFRTETLQRAIPSSKLVPILSLPEWKSSSFIYFSLSVSQVGIKIHLNFCNTLCIYENSWYILGWIQCPLKKQTLHSYLAEQESSPRSWGISQAAQASIKY